MMYMDILPINLRYGGSGSRKKKREDSVERISVLTSEVSGLNKRIGELTGMLKANHVSASETASQKISELLKQLSEKDRKMVALESTTKAARKRNTKMKSSAWNR